MIERFSDDIVDCEITLARSFGWSLYEIERSDTGSILAFIDRLSRQGGQKPERETQQAFCDQVGWL